MKHFNFAVLLLFSFFYNTLFAQQQTNCYTVVVVDSVSNLPIPYVTVIFGNQMGNYSDENGLVYVPENIKVVSISHISYNSKDIDVKNLLQSDTIKLTPKSVELEEVTAVAHRYKTKQIGFFNQKIIANHYGTSGFLMAQLILPDKNYEFSPLINSIIMRLNNKHINFSDVPPELDSKLRIDLRMPDKETGAPTDNSLIDGGIICPVQFKNGKAFALRLPTPVSLPKEGIFIVAEWILPVKSDKPVEYITLPKICEIQSKNKNMHVWVKKQYRNEEWKTDDRNFCLGLGLEITE